MSPPCRRARRDLPPTLSPVHLGQTPPCRDREPTDRPRCLDRELGRPLAAPPSVGRRTPSTERGRPDARSLRTTPAGGVGAGVMERSGPGGHRPAQVLWPCCSFICAMFRTAPWRSSGMPQPQLAHIGGLLVCLRRGPCRLGACDKTDRLQCWTPGETARMIPADRMERVGPVAGRATPLPPCGSTAPEDRRPGPRRTTADPQPAPRWLRRAPPRRAARREPSHLPPPSGKR